MYQLVISSIILLLLDSIFLYTNSSLFSSQIIDIQGTPLKVNLLSAILCYSLLIFGLNYFILREHRSIIDAFILGFIIYGVYETTTFSLLKKWRIKTMIIDTLWGGLLFAITTYLTYKFI